MPLADGVFEFGAALFHAGHDGVAQLGHARGIHLGHALELIGNPQLLVLDDTHRVIRQHFQAHHVVPWSDQATELLAFLRRVGDTRHHHMANNNLNLAMGKLIAKRQDARRIATGQLFMLNRIGMLDVARVRASQYPFFTESKLYLSISSNKRIA